MSWNELLDQDWASLKSFHLTGKEIPGLLEKLRSTRGEPQREAFYTLRNAILSPIDEIIFEVTPRVVPCLAALMEMAQDIDGADHIAALLCELALRCDPLYFTESVWPADERIEGSYDAADEEVVQLVQEGWQSYWGALDHPRPAVRYTAARLLALIPQAREELLPRLRQTVTGLSQAADADTHEVVGTLIALSHCELHDERDSELLETFLGPLSDPPEGLVQAAATIAVAVVDREEADDRLVRQLNHVQRQSYNRVYPQWCYGHLDDYARAQIDMLWPEYKI